MAIHRKSIALTGAENALLKRLYLRWGIPIDQYEKRPHDLAALVDTWNARSDRSDTVQDVMHYMKTQRKRGLWVTFGGNHKTIESPTGVLSPDDVETLIDIYSKDVAHLGLGSDVLSYDEEIGKLIATEFLHRTNRHVPEYILVAKLTELRKRGLLPKVEVRLDDRGIGFADIDDVG